ncbi:hypothetical protein TcCL_Unassigned04437 [Trypanosoma cruzi]|nr:hypothetical protein TcCL_Unassigned04437 [Trypanosoma cruzi]
MKGRKRQWECAAALIPCGKVALRVAALLLNAAPSLTRTWHGVEDFFFVLCLLLWVWVRPRRTCRHDDRSVWLPLCSLERYATTLSHVCCFGDNVLAAVRLPNGGRGAEGIA